MASVFPCSSWWNLISPSDHLYHWYFFPKKHSIIRLPVNIKTSGFITAAARTHWHQWLSEIIVIIDSVFPTGGNNITAVNFYRPKFINPESKQYQYNGQCCKTSPAAFAGWILDGYFTISLRYIFCISHLFSLRLRINLPKNVRFWASVFKYVSTDGNGW